MVLGFIILKMVYIITIAVSRYSLTKVIVDIKYGKEYDVLMVIGSDNVRFGFVSDARFRAIETWVILMH